MTTERSPRSWTCRPSLFVSRMLGFALAMLIALLAVLLFFQGEQVLWLVLAVPLSIWVGFRGGPLLLRGLEKAGLFGCVRIEDDRLTLGRSSRAVRLAEPFEVDARLQTSAIDREYDMRDLGVTRRRIKHRRALRVQVLSLVIAQEGRRFQLVADETNLAPGPEYETAGLAVRPLPVVNAKAPRFRLWGTDLAALLGRLREAAGYATPALGEQPKPLEDPRRAFCPTWKVAVGALAIVAVFVVGSLAAYDAHQERAAGARAAMQARAETMRQEQEGLAQGLVGRRVAVPAQRGARLVGTVQRFELKERTEYDPYRVEWDARVYLTVERRLDGEGTVLSDEAEVSYGFADNLVRRGDPIDARASEVEVLEPDAGP